ncbi:MAG: LysR family transcriptional regulator, partial [Bacillota bacterium]
MTLLRTFVTLAEEGTMSKAADALSYAQPTVSLHLKALEEHYGVPLAEYKGKRYVLTEEGKVLHEYATTILHLAREASDAMTEFRSLERGSLKVGATSNIGVYVLPGLLSHFRCKYPGVRVTVLIDKSWVIQTQVQQGELNVGIVE